MPAMIVRPPVGPSMPVGTAMGITIPPYSQTHSQYSDEYETKSIPISVSRSSSQSQSPPDGADELWCDQDELLALPKYDELLESTADPLFPSPHKFNLMVQDYLKNLSPKKREKALLTQKMYDAVLSVLQDPKDTSTKTAQFRFWAKKMFQLTSFGGEKIVCHDHKPVAVKEQIYEVLCHCHGQAGHGGRDKTSAQVRRYYSWIPKEIIARFVRDCPFCQSRRTQSSAGFSNMSESQAFLISLQTSDTQLANKRPVTLAQARANAAALGHKPHRRPSIRTVDSYRSRRGSAVSDDGYIHYAVSDDPSAMSMPMPTSMDMGESAIDMSAYDETSNIHPYIEGLYVTESASASMSYEFPGQGHHHYHHQQQQLQSEENGGSTSGPKYSGSNGLSQPPMPRRASSYHEQSTTYLDVKPPCDINSNTMIRRNSESNLPQFPNAHPSHSYSHVGYSNPSSANPELMGGNQFLSVPDPSFGGVYGSLSRTTSSSSLNSLNNEDVLSISDMSMGVDMGMGYFSQRFQMDPASMTSSSAEGNMLYTEAGTINVDTKIDQWRESNQIYPISGSTTPLEGNFTFPLPFNMGSNLEVNFFPDQTDYSSISAPPSTYMLPVPEFNFSTLDPTDEPLHLPDQLYSSTSTNINGIPSATIPHIPSSTSSSASAGMLEVAEADQAAMDAVAAVQRMFDQNNIFALGEAAGMSQDQILEIHDTDPDLLKTLGSPTSGNGNGNGMPMVMVEHQISPRSSERINAEFEAISILALATQASSDNLSSAVGVTQAQAQGDQPVSMTPYQVSEESLKHMEFVLSQAVEDVSNPLPIPAVNPLSLPLPPPTVIIEQPAEGEDALNPIFLFGNTDAALPSFPQIMVQEPKCNIDMGLGQQEIDFSQCQWSDFGLSSIT
ncbi:uncharacterized protein I303_103073 [Kwoniella dejecticola CBS 10117]|uniref:Integrase zinc-binding domain-containing protein n=1 Tax=Kwoniella dejecticola CBS 10117 TaxID=1296121 RepID=A0A1A6AAJ8_9TREE|nr:uncharacterized protein I303_03093 [Kwoniella dejecticola CBS 10117]OBR87070.1 hypothetical protein I303_03093 [Kwoniella dejecticola CBS 10117]